MEHVEFIITSLSPKDGVHGDSDGEIDAHDQNVPPPRPLNPIAVARWIVRRQKLEYIPFLFINSVMIDPFRSCLRPKSSERP